MKQVRISLIESLTRTRLSAFVMSLLVSAVVMSVVTSIAPGISLGLFFLTLFIASPLLLETTIRGISRTRAACFGFAIGWILAVLREVYFGAGASSLNPF